MDSKGISIILYPRSYNKRGHHSLHSVQGVTPDGREVNVKLRLDEKHQGQPYAPSIAEFAREDRKAKRACIASPENGPENREGILLFTQAIPDSKANSDFDTYIAKWASVLAEDADSPDPFFGFARMQIARNSSAILKLKSKLREAQKAGATAQEIMAIESRLQDSRNFSYPAIFYYPERGARFPDSGIESAFDFISRAVGQNTQNNLLGGCMIRWTDQDGFIAPNSIKELFPRFVGTKNAFESPVEFTQRVLKDFRETHFGSQGGRTEIIPLIRINTGQVSSAHYGQQSQYQQIQRLYYDQAGDPLVCWASARVSYYEHNDRTYLSRLYSLTEPLGDPRRLSLDGLFDMLFIGEQPKRTLDMPDSGGTEEVSAGLTRYEIGTNLSVDAFFNPVDYAKSMSSSKPDPKSAPSISESTTDKDDFQDSDRNEQSDHPVPLLESAGEMTREKNDKDAESAEAIHSENTTSQCESEVSDNHEQRLDRTTASDDPHEANDTTPVPESQATDSALEDDSSAPEDKGGESGTANTNEQPDDQSGTWLDDIDELDTDFPSIPGTDDENDSFFDDLPVEKGIDGDSPTLAERSDDEPHRQMPSTDQTSIESTPDNAMSDDANGDMSNAQDAIESDDAGQTEETEESGGGLAAFLNL